MSKIPIILKKDDSYRPSRTNQPLQPKILTKASVKETPAVLTSKKISDEVLAPKLMKISSRLMLNFQIDTKFLDHLDSENR